MADADRKVEGYNPLCGDHYTIYLKLDGDLIADVSFDGKGCAISKASASVMSSVLKGKSKAEALQKATLQLRASYPHPYQWAPFILIGKA